MDLTIITLIRLHDSSCHLASHSGGRNRRSGNYRVKLTNGETGVTQSERVSRRTDNVESTSQDPSIHICFGGR
eukprot:1331594-Amorphochlora_amoeboformis.AAC.1